MRMIHYYNKDHLDGKAPAQFRMNALMTLAGGLGWNPVLLNYKNINDLDEDIKDILINVSKCTDSKSALIASLMLLSCKQETINKDDNDAIIDRFNADSLFVHLLQHHPEMAINALSRCTLVPRLDWAPYLTQKRQICNAIFHEACQKGYVVHLDCRHSPGLPSSAESGCRCGHH